MTTFRVRSLGGSVPDRAAMRKACRLAALALMSISAALSRLATRIERREPAGDQVLPRLEFHCAGDGSEGALYLDGHWVASLPGVKRL